MKKDMSEVDAIFPLSGGTIQDANGVWRSTTYEDRDAFGVLGGIVRIRAGAILAQQYPNAFVVADARCMDGRLPSHAEIHARELQELDVPLRRIVIEEKSETTGTQVSEALALAEARNWRHILIVSNEYHLPRIKAFCEQINSPTSVTFVSAESILTQDDPLFATEFERVKHMPAYRERLDAEAQGVQALKEGHYAMRPIDQKRERSA